MRTYSESPPSGPRPRVASQSPPVQTRSAPSTQTSSPPGGAQRLGDATETIALITERLAVLDAGADHYRLLGVTHNTHVDDIRKAYFALARQLHPDRLRALNITDDRRDAQRLFAQVNAAFAELSEPARRADYNRVLDRGGEAAMRAEQKRAEELLARAREGEEAFQRGEAALRRDQIPTAVAEFAKARELCPDEADYHAMYAWASFCAASDKASVASATRALMQRAIDRSPQAVTARFLLGRVERILGRDQEALRHFRDVLADQPYHTEAASEVRAIESRLSSRKR
jgi:curved DNA-binding protein CbpA